MESDAFKYTVFTELLATGTTQPKLTNMYNQPIPSFFQMSYTCSHIPANMSERLAAMMVRIDSAVSGATTAGGPLGAMLGAGPTPEVGLQIRKRREACVQAHDTKSNLVPRLLVVFFLFFFDQQPGYIIPC